MFGNNKTPKSQKPDNAPLYFHRFHTTKDIDYSKIWTQDYRQLVVVDIGHVNLCRRISRRHISPQEVQPIAFDKVGFNLNPDEENFRVLFQELEAFFDNCREEYFNTHVIIIEWQLIQNYWAIRISTFILSYFYFLLKDAPLKPYIIEMRSGFKDDYFPVLKPLNQNARKQKCAEIGKNLLKLMGDQWSLDIMEGTINGKKKTKSKKIKDDDYGDTVIMEEVFCRYADEQGWEFPFYDDIIPTSLDPDNNNSVINKPPRIIRQNSSPIEELIPSISGKKIIIKKNT